MTGITRRSAIAGALAGGAIGPLAAQAARARPTASRAQDSETVMPVMPPLTEYIAGAQNAAAPDAIRERARLHILDTLASIVACRDLEAARLGRAYALGPGGSGTTTILGTTRQAALVDAVFASAMTGHAAEINDFIPSAYVQPGPAIVSAALSLAQARGLSGRQVVSAVIVGYELAGRIPKAIGAPRLYRSGLANHGIGPVFGTGAATASLLGLDQTQVAHMLSYCAQQASGSWQWLLDVRHVEKAFVFAGMGARNGLQATLMAELGFTGVPDSFDVEGGWLRWQSFAEADRSVLIDGLGRDFELSHAAFKRYPTGGPTQPAVEALLALREQIRPDAIAHILIEMPGRADAFRSANMPALNLPYLAAIIMLDGKLDFTAAQSLERMHGDRAVAAFREKVAVVEDATQEAAEGEARVESARVTIVRSQGAPLVKFIPYVRGFPSHPMSREDVERKASELVAPALGQARARDLIDRVAGLDTARPVDDLVAMIGT
ncbi:MmgE/PrpD family protein [Sphingosinithalassobacter portus]|uniref:MmgE/PrpD family protein n=1 Tax=Stakelama portus TaxID=2676234 RepID=UPI001EFEB7AE|nr:MmgE/PrpD family protein [Sphingosinithalassobacter portus]